MTEQTTFLTFELPKSAYTKWSLLTSSAQAEHWATFLATKHLYSEQFGSMAASKDLAIAQIRVPQSELLGQPRFTMSNQFAQYVTGAMIRQRTVAGEVELTAAWAKNNLPRFELEVACAVGRIDILVLPKLPLEPGVCFEAKFPCNWKHALGQALAYRECLKLDRGGDWAAALLLLGDRHSRDYDYRLIESICTKLGVSVYWSM